MQRYELDEELDRFQKKRLSDRLAKLKASSKRPRDRSASSQRKAKSKSRRSSKSPPVVADQQPGSSSCNQKQATARDSERIAGASADSVVAETGEGKDSGNVTVLGDMDENGATSKDSSEPGGKESGDVTAVQKDAAGNDSKSGDSIEAESGPSKQSDSPSFIHSPTAPATTSNRSEEAVVANDEACTSKSTPEPTAPQSKDASTKATPEEKEPASTSTLSSKGLSKNADQAPSAPVIETINLIDTSSSSDDAEDVMIVQESTTSSDAPAAPDVDHCDVSWFCLQLLLLRAYVSLLTRYFFLGIAKTTFQNCLLTLYSRSPTDLLQNEILLFWFIILIKLLIWLLLIQESCYSVVLTREKISTRFGFTVNGKVGYCGIFLSKVTSARGFF